MPGHAELELGSAHGWSLPGQVDEPDVAFGLDVNYAFGPGLFAYFAEDHPLVGAYVSIQPIRFLSVMWGAEWNGNYDVMWIDVEPLFGTWWWDSSPEGHGMLTGLKLVLGHGLPGPRHRNSFAIKTGAVWLNDFSGGQDALVWTTGSSLVLNF